MKAAILHQPGSALTIEEIAVSTPGPREVLIRTRACGVCHSDLHFIDGVYPAPLPCVPGHEAAGVVEAVGDDVTAIRPGDHVVTCFSTFCGRCEFCVTGPAVAVRRRLDQAQADRGAAGDARRQRRPPAAQCRRLCRAAARPRKWRGRDRPRNAVRPRRPDGLRGGDRRRRGAQHRCRSRPASMSR